jgi:putative membrane protein
MQAEKFKNINIEAALRSLILLGFVIFFSTIILSGKIGLYVSPRIVPAVGFGILAMALLFLLTVREIFTPHNRARIAPYLFFIAPLVLAFLVPAQPIQSSSISLQDISITRQAQGGGFTAAGSAKADTQANGDAPLPNQVTSANYEALAALAKKPDRRLTMENDTIVMNDGNFYRWLTEIYDHKEMYKGKKIQVIGFVLRDKKGKDNEFVPARMLMICCTADLQFVGMLCRYDQAKTLQRDAWVKVTGTIDLIQYKGKKVPIILAEEVVSTDKPKTDYVYPF